MTITGSNEQSEPSQRERVLVNRYGLGLGGLPFLFAPVGLERSGRRRFNPQGALLSHSPLDN